MARDRGICVRAVGTYPCQKILISNAHVPVARKVNHPAASTVKKYVICPECGERFVPETRASIHRRYTLAPGFSCSANLT
jgi:hypothetical protein